MRSEMRRYSLDQIGLAIGAAGDNKIPLGNMNSNTNSNNLDNIPSTNASETTPKNSMNENYDKPEAVHQHQQQQQQQPEAQAAKKRISKVADCIKIDYEDLEFYERCGRGSYGSVFRGLWKSRSKVVAIKKIIQLQNEAEILSSCSHRNIIQFFGIVSRESSFCIVTEYAEHGSLNEFIRQHDIYDEFGLGLILNWAHDIALGMNYLHSEAPMKIIHRDLKSNNVLITGNELICKICDFGSSRFGLQTTRMTFTGTFPWMSPEIIQSKPANQSADVWSYGVVLWELITGEVPFKGIDEFQIASLVVEKGYRLPIPNGCPPVMATLMQLCWHAEPKLRPTFKQILTTLDQIDVDDEAKAEMDSLLNKNRPKWETEIEQAFERLKKIENDLQIKEKLLESREKRLREMEMELITNANKLTLEDHDVNSWTESDVSEWAKKLGQKIKGIGAYAEKFLNHNINGRRLMIMSKDDLRNIGITSEGLIIDIFHEIQTLKVENTRLLNFPPLRQPSQNKSQTQIKTSVSYVLLIGSHMIEAGNTQESKWKMYADLDTDLSTVDDPKDFNICSCIRDVKFINKTTFDQFTLNKPPYIMKNWVKGFSNDTKIICTITYEDKVIQPRKTTIEYELGSQKAYNEVIVLTLGDDGGNGNGNNGGGGFVELNIKTSNSSNGSSSVNSIINSNIQLQQAMMSNSASFASLISNNSPISPLGVDNVWKKRNLENSVSIPQETQIKNSSDMWSGVVTGKYKTGKSLPHPALKKLNSEHNFKSMQQETQPPQQSTTNTNQRPPPGFQYPANEMPNKLIRSRTYFEYTRRYSTSSSESQNSGGSRRSDRSSKRGGGASGGSMRPPLLPSSPRPFNSSSGSSSYKRKNSLSGAGRGTLASIKAETSVDLPEANTSTNESTTNRKPIFY